MPADPILDPAVLLDLVLDFLQGEQPALQGRKLALALARDPPLEQADRLLRLRQLDLLLGVFAPGLLQSVSRLPEARFPGQARVALLNLALPPGVALRAKLRKLRVETLPGIGYEAYFGFKAGDIGVGAVELPLRCAQCVPRSVVLCPRLLEIALDFAQPRGLGFELSRAVLDFAH